MKKSAIKLLSLFFAMTLFVACNNAPKAPEAEEATVETVVEEVTTDSTVVEATVDTTVVVEEVK
jgi:hypothetical protein